MPNTEARPADADIQAMAQQAQIPEGCSYSEAYQRLRVVAKQSDEEAERWARLITGLEPG